MPWLLLDISSDKSGLGSASLVISRFIFQVPTESGCFLGLFFFFLLQETFGRSRSLQTATSSSDIVFIISEEMGGRGKGSRALRSGGRGGFCVVFDIRSCKVAHGGGVGQRSTITAENSISPSPITRLHSTSQTERRAVVGKLLG